MLLTRNAAIFCDILGFYLLRTFVYVNHKELLKKLRAFLSVILMREEIEGGKGGEFMPVVHVYFPMDGGWFVVSPFSALSSSPSGALPYTLRGL